LCAEKHRKLGVPEDAIEQAIAEMEAGLEYPINEQRRLAREETIVRVWDVPFGEGEVALVFELLDGTMWQLADDGLGWTKHTAVGPNWTENPVVRKYLPARTTPRPGKPGSWNYEFRLAGAVLWVKLDPSVKKVRWGVRQTKRSAKTR
jgi:hypothetical protein